MRVKYLVIGLSERTVITEVGLSSSGLSYEREYFVIWKNEGSFDTFTEAIKYAESIISNFELGVEIKPIYTNE